MAKKSGWSSVNNTVSVIIGIEKAVKGAIDIYNSLTSDNKKNK